MSASFGIQSTMLCAIMARVPLHGLRVQSTTPRCPTASAQDILDFHHFKVLSAQQRRHFGSVTGTRN